MKLKLFLCFVLISKIECRVKSHVRHGHLRKPLHFGSGQDKISDNFRQSQIFMQHQLNNEHKDRGWKHGRRTSSSEEDRSRSASKSESESWERIRYRFGDKIATGRMQFGKETVKRGLEYAAKFKAYMKERGCNGSPVYNKFFTYYKMARRNLRLRNDTEDALEFSWLDEIAESVPIDTCNNDCSGQGSNGGQSGSDTGVSNDTIGENSTNIDANGEGQTIGKGQEPKSFRIRGKKNEKCLEVGNNANSTGTSVVLNICSWSKNQVYTEVYPDAKVFWFQLSPQHSGMCIGPNNLAHVEQKPCSEDPDLLFRREKTNDNDTKYNLFVHKTTGMCISTTYDANAINSKIILQPCVNGQNSPRFRWETQYKPN